MLLLSITCERKVREAEDAPSDSCLLEKRLQSDVWETGTRGRRKEWQKRMVKFHIWGANWDIVLDTILLPYIAWFLFLLRFLLTANSSPKWAVLSPWKAIGMGKRGPVIRSRYELSTLASLRDKFNFLTFIGNRISKVLIKHFELVGRRCMFPKVLCGLTGLASYEAYLSLQFAEGTSCHCTFIPSARPGKASLTGY